jgi:hypothetical protein
LNCLYCIPYVKGRLSALERILNRIFPLRKSDGGEDHLFILGDLWGTNADNKRLLDRLIQLSTVPNVHILSGRIELAFINNYQDFLLLGGYKVAASYWMDINPNFEMESLFGMEQHRLIESIPSRHIEFLRSLPSQIDFNGYCFSNVPVETHLVNVTNSLVSSVTDTSIQIGEGSDDEVIIIEAETLKGFRARQTARLVEFDLMGD